MTKFDVQAEEREERLAKKRRQAFDNELFIRLTTKTHAESVRDFLEVLGCLDGQVERMVVQDGRAVEYAY